MPSILYLNSATPAVVPSPGTKHPSLPVAKNYAAVGSEVEGSLDEVQQSPQQVRGPLLGDPNDTTNPQSFFWGRFSSKPLAAQTLPVQRWELTTYQQQGSGIGDTYNRPCVYIWRPSTQQVVGYIFAGGNSTGPQSSFIVEWYANFTPNATDSWVVGGTNTVNVPNAITTEDGDILVFEYWAYTVKQVMSGDVNRNLAVNDPAVKLELGTSTLVYYTPPLGPVGSLSVTNEPDTIVADASVVTPPRFADLARTEAQDTVSATAKSEITANLSRTEAADAIASTAGAPPALATLAVTEAPDTVVSTAGATAGATLTRTEAQDTVVSAAIVVPFPVIGADLAVTEATDAITAAAGTGPAPVIADLTVTEAPDTVTSAATVVYLAIVANLSVTEAPNTIASAATVRYPKVETFQEDFELPVDVAKWAVYETGGTVAFSGGTSVQSITSAVIGNQATIISQKHFDFIESSLFYRFVQPIRVPGDVAGVQNGMGVRTPTGGRTIQWYLDTNGALQAVKQDNFAITVIAVVEPNYYANPLPYAWLRVREKAGVTYWDSAPDTASNPPIETDWVNRAQAATSTIAGPWTDTLVNLYTYMGTDLAGVPTQPLKVDGVNTAATVAGGVLATLSSVEAADTISSAATVEAIPPVSATLTQAEAPDTIAAIVKVAAGATLTRTEARDTVVASASSAIAANLTRTEAQDTIVSAASSPIRSNLSVTEAPDIVTAAAGSVVTGALTSTEAPDTVASAAAVLPFPVIGATFTVQEAEDRLASSAGTPAGIADLFVSEAPDTIVASASSPARGTLTRTEAPDAIAATARVVAGASLARTEAADSLASSATVPATANLSKTEFDDTLASIVKSAVVASLSIQEAGDTLTGSAMVRSGSEAGLTVTEDRDTLEATGTVADPISFANLSVTEQSDTSFMYTVHAKKRVILVT